MYPEVTSEGLESRPFFVAINEQCLYSYIHVYSLQEKLQPFLSYINLSNGDFQLLSAQILGLTSTEFLSFVLMEEGIGLQEKIKMFKAKKKISIQEGRILSHFTN